MERVSILVFHDKLCDYWGVYMSEEVKKEVFVCPRCGNQIDKILRVEGRNQYICPICKATIKSTLIPEGIEVEILPRKKKKEVREEIEEEEEIYEEERPSVYERIKTPTEILVEVLRRYNVKEECIRLLKAKSEMREGGLHPLELEQRLNEFSKAFTGISDRRLIPDIVEDYMYMLQREQEKARQRGIRYVVPPMHGRGFTPSTRYVYEPSPTHTPRTPRYEMDYYGTRRGMYTYEMEGGRGEVLTRDDVLKMLMEWDRQREERTKMDRLMEMIAKQQETIIKLQEELRHLRENPPQVVPPDVVTKTELKALLTEQQKDAYQKYLERKLEETTREIDRLLASKEKADERWEKRLKELQDRYEKLFKEIQDRYEKEREKLEKKIEEARKETEVRGYKSDEVRFRADVMKETRGIIQDVLDRAPLRKTLQVTISPVREQPPKRKEEESASEIPEELPPELIIEEE